MFGGGGIGRGARGRAAVEIVVQTGPLLDHLAERNIRLSTRRLRARTGDKCWIWLSAADRGSSRSCRASGRTCSIGNQRSRSAKLASDFCAIRAVASHGGTPSDSPRSAHTCGDQPSVVLVELMAIPSEPPLVFTRTKAGRTGSPGTSRTQHSRSAIHGTRASPRWEGVAAFRAAQLRAWSRPYRCADRQSMMHAWGEIRAAEVPEPTYTDGRRRAPGAAGIASRSAMPKSAAAPRHRAPDPPADRGRGSAPERPRPARSARGRRALQKQRRPA